MTDKQEAAVAEDGKQEWYWCTRHDRVEPARQCPASVRMGPYDTPEDAARYAERAAQRNEAWEAEDRAWGGSGDR